MLGREESTIGSKRCMFELILQITHGHSTFKAATSETRSPRSSGEPSNGDLSGGLSYPIWLVIHFTITNHSGIL